MKAGAMILIGITGPIGHGKTTFANNLASLEPRTKHFESFEVVAEVADALHQKLSDTIPKPREIQAINQWLKSLPLILEQVLHVKTTYEQIKLDPQHVDDHPVEYEKLFVHLKNLADNPELAGQAITAQNKSAYRPILQWLGGYLVKKVDLSIWYDEIIRRAYEAGRTGTKLCVIGGVRFPADADVIRDADGFVIKIYRPGTKQQDLNDPTERERENIQTDSAIINDGQLTDLKATAAVFLRDAQQSKLRPRYSSKKD